MPGQIIHGKNYIGGRWVESSSRATFRDLNPANIEDVIGEFPESTGEDVLAAVTAAEEAYPAWRRLSRIKRGEHLDRFVQLVKARAEELAREMARECGKQINECRADVTEGIHMAQYESGLARLPYGAVVASEVAEKDAYVLRRPKGVVACITPWNFPFAIPLWLITPSLLEGNTAVFKPSEDTPLMGQRILELLAEAGLPPGVLNLVQGHGEGAGAPLVAHPAVKVVLFTGSKAVGGLIRQACARSPDKLAVCEMGGKNALIVCEDADLDLAARAAVLSAFKTTGQRCVSAERLIVHRQALSRFQSKFVELASRVVSGDPLDQSVFMGPLINADAAQKVARYNRLAKAEGAQVLLDGGRLRDSAHAQGYFFSPFVYRLDHRSDARVLREEVFGPHVALIPYGDDEEAVRIHNDTDYGLAFSVITEDYRKARYFRQECETGIGYWNLPTIGAEVQLPFGGAKASGTGMPSAAALNDAVSHRTAWTVNHAREIVMAQGLSAEVKGALAPPSPSGRGLRVRARSKSSPNRYEA